MIEFWWYELTAGRDPWGDWYKAQDSRTKARHDVAFDYLEVRKPHEWRKPFSKKLKNSSMWEICIHATINHRLIGFFGPRDGMFSIVMCCTHKEQVYTPKDAIKTAAARMKEVTLDSNKVVRCDRPS